MPLRQQVSTLPGQAVVENASIPVPDYMFLLSRPENRGIGGKVGLEEGIDGGRFGPRSMLPSYSRVYWDIIAGANATVAPLRVVRDTKLFGVYSNSAKLVKVDLDLVTSRII